MSSFCWETGDNANTHRTDFNWGTTTETSSCWGFNNHTNNTSTGWNFCNTDTKPHWHYDEFSLDKTASRNETVVPHTMDREYLVFGYGRNHSNTSIPSDILDLCLNMYGMEGFSFTIEYDQLKKTHYYRSNTFCCNHMQFQIIMKQKPDSSTHQWGWSTVKELQFYMKLMNNTISPQHKTAKIIAACTIYCTQLQKHFQCMINTSFTMMQREDGLTLIDTLLFLNESELKSFDVIDFHGTLNILHIDILDTTHHTLSVFHVHTIMQRQIEYNWDLKPVFSPDTKSYCSPSFGSNHWNLLFQQPSRTWSIGTQFSLKLQLLSFPPTIACIRVLWRCVVECNGVSYTNAKVQMLALKSMYCFNSYQWTLADFGVMDKSQIPPISFKVYIEIINAETREYNTVVTDPETEIAHMGWDDWSGSSQITAGKTITNDKLSEYGIVEDDGIKDWNEGRLALQQQIKGVKQSKLREDPEASGFSWSYPNSGYNTTISTPLYIDKDDSTKRVQLNNGNEQETVEEFVADDIVVNAGGFSSWWATDQQDEKQEIASDWRTLAMEEIHVKEKEEAGDGLGEGFGFGIESEANDECKAYEWIENVLKRITPNCWENVLNDFKTHEVTDERLNDLDRNDWKEIIKRIGIRNEMMKLFKLKKNTESIIILPSDSEL